MMEEEATENVVERRRLRFITVNLALVNLVMCINFAILAPFYPNEAKIKGVSTVVTGVIFGEFEGIIFLTAPIFGILLPRIGAKFMYISGILISAVCSILFGVLVYCPAGASFILTSVLVRGVMAVGCSMLVTASFAIIAVSYPDNVTTMFGLLETFSGIGLMAGPPVGGALYQLGGYVLPFAVMGGLMLLVVPVTMCTLSFDSDALPSRTGSFLSILVNPHIAATAVVMWGAAITIGFLDPIFQPFLNDQFHLNEFLVGLVFLCGPALYAILAPVFGHICDKKLITKEIMCGSLIFVGISMLIVGPSKVLHIGPPRLWLTILSCFFFGIGVGGAMVPATKDVLTECLLMGYQDNFGTFSLVSGAINSFLSLGFFTGPLVSGVLTEKYGFISATSSLGFFLIGLGCLYTVYTVVFMYCLGGHHRQILTAEQVEEVEERQPLVITS